MAALVHGRALTWVRDRPKLAHETPDLLATPLLGTDAPPATSANEDLIVSILNQLGLGSCTANAAVQAIRALQMLLWLTAARVGPQPTEIASRLWAYFLARLYDHDTARDDGTQIRQIFAALVKYGFPLESVWPYSDATGPGAPFSKMPSPDAWRAAFDAKFPFSAHRITSTGYDRVDDVKRALGQRRLVVFGTDVSEDFCAGRFDPTVPLDPPVGLAIAGGHARCYASHKDAGVRVANSWGGDWQDRGYSVDSWDYVAWGNTNDLWVVDHAAMPGGIS